MKRYWFVVLLLVCVLCSIVSCSKEFNSNAPYKDVTVVYGIINCAEEVQYVKIYKGFLTSHDAYEAAQVYDSLYYFDKITVELEEYAAGRLLNRWQLDTTTAIPRENNGDLSSPKQLLYVLPHPINPANTYKLLITNNETGRIVTAETNIVGDFRLNSPATQSVDISHTTNKFIKYTAADNAAAYMVVQYFNFLEKNRTTGEITPRTLKRNLTASPITSTDCSYVPRALYDYICESLEENDNIERYLLLDSAICYEIWAVNETFYKYVLTNTITSSVVLDHLSYTNITSNDQLVAGFFGSRAKVANYYRLNNQSIDILLRGSEARKLNFRNWTEYEEK